MKMRMYLRFDSTVSTENNDLLEQVAMQPESEMLVFAQKLQSRAKDVIDTSWVAKSLWLTIIAFLTIITIHARSQ